MSLYTAQKLFQEKYKEGTPDVAFSSNYTPDEESVKALNTVRSDFVIGYQNQTQPRKLFNDLSLLDRISVDQMSWNTYQPNDGMGYVGDTQNAWRSNAIRPVVRNKCISTAAHLTAKLIYPAFFAQDPNDNDDKDASLIMGDLFEYSTPVPKYSKMFLNAVISAIVNPYCVVETEYKEIYRDVKREQADGSYKIEKILDEDFSGFIDDVLEPEQILFENFYEEDIQKQGFLIKRKVISYSNAFVKYAKQYENFKFVKPGVQLIYNDVNQTFYEVADRELMGINVEEVKYYNKALDLELLVVNGVLLTAPDKCNPRNDKRYPFAKTFYESFGVNCFAGKSLVFKMGPDARIINELYPMIIDGTYLSLFPPMFMRGDEEIGSDVIQPGKVTVSSDPNAEMKVINTSNNLAAGLTSLATVTQSLNQSSIDPQLQGESTAGTKTAYEVAKLQQNANTDLGLFTRMISNLVYQLGVLRTSDILQYLTVADVEELTDGSTKMKYKAFLLDDRETENGNKTRKIQFDLEMPDKETTETEVLGQSFDLMEQSGGLDSKKEIYKVNPRLFRNLKFKVKIAPDQLNPLSKEIERAFNLEGYDRMIANPLLDQDKVTKDFLLSSYDQSKRDPDAYMKQADPMAQAGMGMGMAEPGYAPGQQGSTPAANDIMSKITQMSGEPMAQPPKNIA